MSKQKKNYLLSMTQDFWDEISHAAKETDSTVADYIRRACRTHLYFQHKYLKENLAAVRKAKNEVEDRFWAMAEAENDVYLL